MAGMFVNSNPRSKFGSLIYVCENEISRLMKFYPFIEKYHVQFIKYNKKMFLEIQLWINEPLYMVHLLSTGIKLENIIKEVSPFQSAASLNGAELKVTIIDTNN